MSEILQANVFFFITSVAVVVFTILVCVILYHVIKILGSIRAIVAKIEEGSDLIAEDMSMLRTFVIEGSLVSQIMSFFLGKKARKAPLSKKSKDITNE